MEAVLMANIGCSFCKRNTTEKDIKCTLRSAVVNQSVPRSPLKNATNISSHHSRLPSCVFKTYLKTNGDKIITEDLITHRLELNDKDKMFNMSPQSLIVRTIPNNNSKLHQQYSGTNPAYFHHKAIEKIVDAGIEHVLTDLPSVDKEQDDGILLAHKAFWNYPQNPQLHKTITEMIYVDDTIKDGWYFLNLQIASFENDASPSKPVLYKIL